MSKSLLERLHNAKEALARVEGALNRRTGQLPPDEFRAIASFATLIETLLQAGGFEPAACVRVPPLAHDGPETGRVLTARGRQWLVEEIIEGEGVAAAQAGVSR